MSHIYSNEKDKKKTIKKTFTSFANQS
jgi:hypothetical protein